MPIGTPTLFGSGAGTTSAATTSATPSANALLIAVIGARQAAATIPTISDDLGGTWTQIHADADQDAGVPVANIFYHETGGSPSAMVITGASTGASQTGIHVIEVTGNYSTDFSNFKFNINATGDPSLTMDAFSTGGICLGLMVGNAGGGATTPPTGHTELLDSLIATNLRMDSSYDTTSPGTSLTWASASTDSVGYGLEIKEASGSTYTLAADAGSYAVTGTAASLEFGRLVGATSGSYTLSGQTATLLRNLPLTATAGSYLASGTDASLERGYKISADAGSYAVSGTDATLTYDTGLVTYTLVVDPGSYLVTGTAATFTYVPTTTATSAGSYNMYRGPDEPKRKKLRKIKYIGPAEERQTFYVEATPKNKWIPATVRSPSVLATIERTGLKIRQQRGSKIRRIIMADDEWFMLN